MVGRQEIPVLTFGFFVSLKTNSIMKPSIDAIINEFALRGLDSKDHELFMRRVANALNGYPKESMFFGRITRFTLKGDEFLPDMFGEAKKGIWDKPKRDSAKMTEFSFELTENYTAIRVCFKYEATGDDGNLRTGSVDLTVRQDSVYADAFDITVD